ncbi:MAG TPA: hypothetical protein VGN20_26085 [Mucilaginibacter sp.]|jgi:hypothetical protein
MKPIASTAEILVFKMLGYNVNTKWIDWAYGMLVAGFENEDLVILAGELEPYNQFELQILADKVFFDLNLNWDDRELICKNYVCYLVSEAVDGRMLPINVLDILKDIYLSADYDPPYDDFYELYYAYDDLKYSKNQWYIAGVTRENINEIIKAYFVKWSNGCA